MSSNEQVGTGVLRSPGARVGGLRRPDGLLENVEACGLVDPQLGVVDRIIYTDERLYQQELRRIFARSWLFLAHEDQFRNPGDFFTTWMGEDPIIVTKDRKGRIRAYLNSCRHRGARVCRADSGRTKNFTCTYHGWAFDLDGELVSVPDRDNYPDHFDPRDWGLIEVPSVQSYKGLIFGNWDSEAESLVDNLGDMAWYLDAFLDRDPDGTVVVGDVHRWILEGNWKFMAEQFCTDWYHVNMSHASALYVMTPPGKKLADAVINRRGRQFVSDHGHGAGFPVNTKTRFDAQRVHEWYDYDALRERLTEARVQGPMTTGHATIFPNFSYLPVNGSIRVWHPRGPNQVEVWAWTIVDKSMPAEVVEAQRLHNLRTFGPSGIFEQDDGENWSEIHAVSKGFITRETPLNFQMALGTAAEDGVHPGRTAALFSDAAGLSFYRRWVELMDSPAWHETRPRPTHPMREEYT